MQEELANAIANVRFSMQTLKKPLEPGSVIKHQNGDIAVVLCVAAPEEAGAPWGYGVCYVQVGGEIVDPCEWVLSSPDPGEVELLETLY